MIENGFKAAEIMEALDLEKDFGEEDPFPQLIQVLCICFYVYAIRNVSELFKGLFLFLQHLSETSEIRLRIGQKMSENLKSDEVTVVFDVCRKVTLQIY